MASYLILTPPEGPDKINDKTRFVRDGFSWTALLFPTLWLLFHRLWLYAVAAFLLQGIAIELIRRPGFFVAGIAVLLGVRLLAALEGRHALCESLLANGWKTESLVSAPNLGTAEEIYFSGLEAKTETNIRANDWDIPSRANNNPDRGGPAFGLPGYDGGR